MLLYFVFAMLFPVVGTLAFLAIAYAVVLVSALLGIVLMVPTGWLRTRRLRAAYERRAALERARDERVAQA